MRPHAVTLLVATMLVAACERDGPVAPLRPAEPLMEIADASRDPSRLHFYFLPPMAAQPAYAGIFDASALPHVAVEVCELAGAGCGARVAGFTAAGRGLERVSTSEYFEHFLALWRTNGANVSAGKIYRVTVLVAGTALGYADVKLVRTLREAKAVDREQYAVALKGLPLPIRFRIETGAVFLIGPEGGIVTAGAVSLDFPEGAVPTTIGITIAPATLAEGVPAPVAGTAFDFGPDGTKFRHPVKLSITYPDGTPNESQLGLHKLVGSAWQLVENSTVDVENNGVSGTVGGFSEYAVLPARPDPGLVGDIAFVSRWWDASRNNHFVDVFVGKEDGSNAIKLTNNPDYWVDFADVAWSATGNKLAFVRGYGIQVVGATDADFRDFPDISGNPPDPGSLTWAPLGPRGDLFFTLNSRIFSMHSTGGVPQEMAITGFPLPRDATGTLFSSIACQFSDFGGHGYPPSLAVSANGAHIAFTYRETCEVTHRESGGTGRREIQSVGFANTATGQVVGDISEFDEFGRRYDTDGIELSKNIRYGAPYAWSPTDANKVVVTAYFGYEDPGYQLVLVDIVTKTIVPLLTPALFRLPSCQFPGDDECYDDPWFLDQLEGLVWSPAGDKLAFAVGDPGHDFRSSNGSDIWVLDMSVTPHTLTNLTPNMEGDEIDPSWSRDGTRIAFVSWKPPEWNKDIYVVSVAAPGTAQRLTVNQDYKYSPRWRP